MNNQQPRKRSKHIDASDMTPMVDVVFLLLIFFVVTASFQMQKSLAMDSQTTDAPSPIVELFEKESVQLHVDDDGTFTLITSDGQCETPSKQFLVAKLRESVAAIGSQAELVVKVHEQAALQLLVDAMDAGSIAGFSQVQVAQVEEFQ